MAALLAACQPLAPEAGHPCPCAGDWVCCLWSNTCAPEPAACPAGTWGDEVDLQNVSPFCTYTAAPGGRDSGVFAARLTPREYPFAVHRVVYVMEPFVPYSDTVCRTDVDHEVLLFLGDGRPEPEPRIERRIAVQGTEDGRMVVHSPELDEPLVVERGDLFIAIPTIGDLTHRVCVEMCTAGIRGGTWVSDRLDLPWTWEDGADYGVGLSMAIRAVGRVWHPW